MLSIERNDCWVTLRLDRPEVGNALNGEVIAKLHDALATLQDDPEVRGLVLTGTGKVFSAGADLSWMNKMKQASEAENLRDAKTTGALFHALSNFPRPVVALVNGPARGGGVGLVAACDFAVASTTAHFAFTEVRLGIIPAVISPFVLRKLGESRARRLFLTGETFSAEQALTWGLLDRVLPPNELERGLDALMQTLQACAPGAIARVKELVREVSGASDEELSGTTARLLAEARVSPEAQEGMSAFLEKRPAAWVK
jgi:methylglutaconyl-CoA hydratase